jgi:D-tyrosyl-tRNA(Tyr) deacylase
LIACLQRVSRASVRVEGAVVGAVERGLLVFLGIAKGDTDREVEKLAARVSKYRCFPHEDTGKLMDRSIVDLGLGALVVSQFTLCADTRRGLRPGFDPAMPPEQAEPMYESFVGRLRECGVERVETGRFGAMMQVEIVNEGPVTLLLEQRPS